MATLDEVNRPPGGKDSIRLLIQNTFLQKDSVVLDVGCNTGYCTFEIAHIAKCKVTGLDVNKNMIASATHFLKTVHQDVKNAVDFVVGAGETLPFPHNTFDLLMTRRFTFFSPHSPTTP